jgi:hypothetical protein
MVVKEIFICRNIARPHCISTGYGAPQFPNIHTQELFPRGQRGQTLKLNLHLHVVSKSARLGAIPPSSVHLPGEMLKHRG